MKPSECLGYYYGTCTNTTAGQSANLVLILTGVAGERIHGEIGLYGDLGGGGIFVGNVDSHRLSFTTSVPAEQVAIDWAGDFVPGGLTGSYKVECNLPELAFKGLRYQEGVWACSFVRPLGFPDSARSQSVIIFHAGQYEGPLTMEQFAANLQAGRYPASAVVALEDATTWCSVEEFVAFIESKQVYQQQQSSFTGEIARHTGTKVISTVLAALILGAFGLSDYS